MNTWYKDKVFLSNYSDMNTAHQTPSAPVASNQMAHTIVRVASDPTSGVWPVASPLTPRFHFIVYKCGMVNILKIQIYLKNNLFRTLDMTLVIALVCTNTAGLMVLPMAICI